MSHPDKTSEKHAFDGHRLIRTRRRSRSIFHNDQCLNTTTNASTMHWHRYPTCFTAEAVQNWQRCMCMRLVLRECEHSTVIVYAKHVAMRGLRWVAQVLARGVQWEYNIKLCIIGAAESRGAIHVHFACPLGEDHLIIRFKRCPGTMKKDGRSNFFVGSAEKMHL